MRTRIRLLASFLVAFSFSHAAAEEPSVARGGAVYEKNCANCHGDDLQNHSTIAFDLRRLRASEHTRFIGSVLHGKKAMPSWEGALTMEQIEDLWDYVRTHSYQQ